MSLRSLDDRLVPRAAAWLQRLPALPSSQRPAPGPDADRAPEQRHVPNTPALPPKPPWSQRLADVDRQHTESGVFGLLRELPQLGYVVLAVLVVANGLVFMSRKDTQTLTGSDAPIFSPLPEASARVGPVFGNRVAPYLTTRRHELSVRAAGKPDAQGIAVVSFADYQRIEDVTPFLDTVRPLRSYVRVTVPKEQTDIREIPVRNFETDMTFGYRLLYAKLVTDAQGNITQANTTTDPAFKQAYEHDSRLWYKEAALLQRDCPCIFAVLVQGSLRRLADLALNPGVRLVDLAPEDAAVEDLSFRGLLPEEKKLVTNLNEAG